MRGPDSDRPAGARPPRHPPLGGEAGVQLVELAILLPLLMVLVVGVFDFGAAFNLKQQLTNAARSAAGFGSSQPTNDLANGGVPDSVLSIRNLVDDRLVAAGINDCNLLGTAGAPSGTLVWTFSAAGNGCPGTLTLTVDRSYAYPTTLGVNMISTHVQISYPYHWQFGNVIGLLAPGATYANGVTQIPVDAIVPNAD
jgi:Flp pilus assembly protein TadG